MKTHLGIIYILDRDFETVGLVDQYYSLIWTHRFRGEGEFELELPPDPINRVLLQLGRYVQDPGDTSVLMIIERLEIDSDMEDGAKLKVKGRSLESILRYHICQVVHTGEEKVNQFNLVYTILLENLVNATNEAQKLPGFDVLEKDISPPKPDVELEQAREIDGNNIYELINEIAEYYDVGWRVKPNYQTKKMIFEFYDGIDRSYAQTLYPWVVFSPSYDNLISTNYYISNESYFNVAYVKSPASGTWEENEQGEISPLAEETGGGGGGGSETKYPIRHIRDQFYMAVYNGETEPSGLDRRAMFLDLSSDFSWEIEDTEKLYTVEQMRDLLRTRALTELSEKKQTEAFDGEVETLRQYQYGVDFGIGDICQIKNEFGVERAIRVSEVVQSMDGNGYSLVPTFVNVEWHANS